MALGMLGGAVGGSLGSCGTGWLVVAAGTARRVDGAL